ncbi:Bug family tripartite tricarboxylate transporter substrate binding protein [Ideonella livida]|uniref:Bug family tripartite tricarboxylate transporter substrate binding protein n=1 Tax=Ideonella livida TaxID=2707176 RepID=UPI002872D24B|nr:tripartite tricarboxylate transporter substrate binding protein [Ideonella livida]
MRIPRRQVHRLAGALALGVTLGGTLLPGAALAQSAWPSKPLRIVVPYSPGGSSDIIARTIAPHLEAVFKQTVLVENKPGANGNTGSDTVAKATDGHTLLLCDVGALAITPSVYKQLPFNPSKDLRGVSMLAYSPHLLVVHPSVPANNLRELVALSKKEKMNFAVTAQGSAPHLAGIAVEKATGADWAYIPYKGGAQALADTMAGQTQIVMNGMLATLPHVQSGKLKVLAVSKATRVAQLPQVPTIAEQGVAGFESGTWQGVLMPAGTPDAVVQKVATELQRIVQLPEVRDRLQSQGAEVHVMGPADLGRFYETERARWAKVVAQGGVSLD